MSMACQAFRPDIVKMRCVRPYLICHACRKRKVPPLYTLALRQSSTRRRPHMLVAASHPPRVYPHRTDLTFSTPPTFLFCHATLWPSVRAVDARKSDIIGSLVTDVYTVSSGLRTANGKLDSIMSMLLSMGSGKNQAARSNHTPPASRDSIVRDDAAAAAAASEGGDDANFGGGGAQSASAAAAARGEFGQSLVGRDSAGAGTRRGGRDLYAYGELFDYRPSPPRIPVDHQQQEWAGHPPLHSHRFHQPSPAERYPVVSNHVSVRRYREAAKTWQALVDMQVQSSRALRKLTEELGRHGMKWLVVARACSFQVFTQRLL